MKVANLHTYWLAALSSLAFGQMHAQTVVKVSQVLPFASTGAVSSLAKGEAAVPAVPTPSTTTEPTVAPALAATLSVEGGRIVTGADGASSLLLGSSGTACMGAESEVRVPEATEKNHSLELLRGKLFMNIRGDEIKKRAAGEFRLKTPAALLAVKGTKFFTVSSGGTDTIGVHEGSVTVTEPTTSKSVTLEAGYAMTVSPGILSETRAMTDEEKGYTAQYAAAELVRTPLPLAVRSPVPNARKIQILVFSNGRLSVMGEEPLDPVHLTSPTALEEIIGMYLDWYSSAGLVPGSASLTPDGVVRYAWKDIDARGTYRCEFSLRTKDVFPSRVIGIQLRMRTKNVVEARFGLAAFTNMNNNNRPVGEQRMPVSMLDNGIWLEHLWPIPKSGSSATQISFNLDFNTIKLGEKRNLPGNKLTAVDLTDFVLLSLPK